ncbi:MAG: PAS domain-containing protein, partial [Anaerovoracaceae bacterium]
MVSGEELRELLLQGEEERKNNKLLHLLNSVPGGIGIYQWGEKGFRQIYLNDGFFELLGDTRANREAKTMKDPFQGVHPEDRKRVEAAVREVAEGKTHLDLNYRLRRADCEYIWMRFLGRVIAEKDGNRYIYGSFFDVDDQTKAQVSLEQS